MSKAIEDLFGNEIVHTDGIFAVCHDTYRKRYVAYANVHGHWTRIASGVGYWPVQQRVNAFIQSVKENPECPI
jgi:hypothetical protein